MIFIVSWAGQHKNACFIANQIVKTHHQVVIVYSDPDPDFVLVAPCPAIRRPNELFWADKFKACLDAVGHEGMLLIHADCQCNDWVHLVNRCHQVGQNFKNIGVWAPKIQGTHWHVGVTQIVRLKNNDLVPSAFTDGIVFYLAPGIIDRMRQVNYERNVLGWGIDLLFCTHAHCTQKWVVIDLTVQVIHPKGQTGYDTALATLQSEEFLDQFTLRERVQHQLLTTHVKYNYAKLAAKKKPRQ